MSEKKENEINKNLNNNNLEITNQTLTNKNNDQEIISCNEALNNYNRELLFYEKLKRTEEYKKCTYNKGYIEQEIYFCKTCFEENKKYGIICLGCYFQCHEDHEVINLFYKRNVKCDCGNSHFEINCSLIKDKDYENYLNNYNHNFEGKYCYCDKEDDNCEMIQCFFCEDWFHFSCINAYFGNENLGKGEFVCRNCVKKFCFLFENYDLKKFVFGFIKDEEDDDENENKINEDIDNNKNDNNNNKIIVNKNENNNNNNNINNINKLISGNEFGKKRKHNEIEKNDEININNNNNICKLKENKFNITENKKLLEEIISNKNELIISTKNLEKILCYCESCKELYKEKKLDYLISGNFYTEWYKRVLFEDKIEEEINKNTDENKEILNSIENIDLFKTNVIKSLDVEKQIELALVSNEFINEFKNYLSNLPKIKENKNSEVIITDEDIKDFLNKFQTHLLK